VCGIAGGEAPLLSVFGVGGPVGCYSTAAKLGNWGVVERMADTSKHWPLSQRHLSSMG
jgi:hypothetical protein